MLENSETRTMALEKPFAQEWKSISAVAVDSANTAGCFECNICLDSARDPVVTLCGHLYCWPCIYKWFHFQSASLASDKHPQCPVCKAEISHSTVVPLYGRGLSPSDAELDIKAPSVNMTIPPRPPACGTKALMTTSQPGQQFPYRDPYGSVDENSPPPSLNLSGSTNTASLNPATAGMFGEMVYARVFGNSENLQSHTNSYHQTGSTSPRLRRLEIESDKSLNRVSVFLFFCFLICLLLF